MRKHINQNQPHTSASITGNATNLRLCQESEIMQLKSFYHGRSVTHEEKVNDNLTLMNMYSRKGLDFDPKGSGGIYFAHEPAISRHWAIRQAESCRDACYKERKLSKPWGVPVMYTYDVPDEELVNMNAKTWNTVKIDEKIDFSLEEDKQDWQKFVLSSRMNETLHSYDMVTGPMMLNPIPVLGEVRRQQKSQSFNPDLSAAEVRWNTTADQTAIYSQRAKELFQKHLKEREIIDHDNKKFEVFRKTALFFTQAKTRAEISRFRLDNQEAETTTIIKKHVEQLRKSMILHYISVIDPLPEHKSIFTNCLDKYKALGELEDTLFSVRILEIERELQKNQIYKNKSNFEDFLMGEADFRCLACLLNYNTGDLITKLSLPFLNDALTHTKDFTTAYQIAKTVRNSAIEYLPKLSNVELGTPLGSGRKKNAYRLPDGTVMVRMKAFDFFNALSREIGMLDLLKKEGLPVVDILGITLHNGMPAMIMPYMPEQSKDFIANLTAHIETPAPSCIAKAKKNEIRLPKYMQAKTLKDLVQIQIKLKECHIHINDLQFLIGENGEIVIADPRIVKSNSSPSKGNIGTINYTLAAGIVKMLNLIQQPNDWAYSSLSDEICTLTGLDFPQQIYDIIQILKSKYKINVTDPRSEIPKNTDALPPLKKQPKKAASAPPKTKTLPNVPNAHKDRILAALNGSPIIKNYDDQPRKFLEIPNSKDTSRIGELFNLTPSEFYDAFLVLRSEEKVACDKSGLYLLN